MQKIVLLILCLQLTITQMYASTDNIPALITFKKQALLLKELKTKLQNYNEAGPARKKKATTQQKIIALSALAGGSMLIIYLGYRGIKMITASAPDQDNNPQPPVYNNMPVMLGAAALDVVIDAGTINKETGEGFLTEETAQKTSHLVNRVAAFIDKIATDINEE